MSRCGGRLLSTAAAALAAAAAAASSGPRGRSQDIEISKALAYILRHKAARYGVAIRPDGYCKLDDVLRCEILAPYGVSVQEVRRLVEINKKRRFELCEEDGVNLIRAVQGHSIKAVQDDRLLRRLQHTDADLPAVCVHGTTRSALENILQQGLRPGGGKGPGLRNHVHFAAHEPDSRQTISGLRHNAQVAIWVDLKEALAQGVPFYLSTNQVILSPGDGSGVVPPRFFYRVKDLATGQQLDPATGAPMLPGTESQ